MVLNKTLTICVSLDVNECDNYCKYGTCINSIGSFQCQCPMGSFYNATSNLCQDSDECQTNQHQCDPVREICRNENVLQANKTYNCSCRPGWESSNAGNVCVGQCISWLFFSSWWLCRKMAVTGAEEIIPFAKIQKVHSIAFVR